MCKTSPSGREITLYLVQPGEMCILGISCLLSDARYPARAEVRTDTEALGIPAAAFRRMDERLAVFLLKEAERVPGTWEPGRASRFPFPCSTPAGGKYLPAGIYYPGDDCAGYEPE